MALLAFGHHRAEEVTGRDEATVRLRRRRAGFPADKTFDGWDETRCSIPQPTQAALRTLEWVDRRENLCICGPSGTGKSHFCEALGQLAIDTGRTVAWFAIDELGALVRRHRADDTVARAISRITRADLIVVDDIGMLPVGPDAAEGFYRLVDAAYEKRSLAVSSNLHPAKGHRFAATCARWRRTFTGSAHRAAVLAMAMIGRAAPRSRRSLTSTDPNRAARRCGLVTARGRRR